MDNPDFDAEYDAAMSALAADGLPEDTPAGDLSHDALALAVGQLYADQWRYVDLWGHWYLWAGTHWQRDDKRRVWTLVREFVRDRAIGLDTKTATKLRAAETIAATVNLSRSNVEFAALAGDWDRDPYLLGTPAGTVDLRTWRAARGAAWRLHHQAHGHGVRAAGHRRADVARVPRSHLPP